MPPALSITMSGSLIIRTGSLKMAWSNVIPFDRLVLGAWGAGAGAVTAVKLDIPRRTPTEQRANASKTRGLKRLDLEMRFVFIMFSFREIVLRLVALTAPEHPCATARPSLIRN